MKIHWDQLVWNSSTKLSVRITRIFFMLFRSKCITFSKLETYKLYSYLIIKYSDENSLSSSYVYVWFIFWKKKLTSETIINERIDIDKWKIKGVSNEHVSNWHVI